MENAGGKKRRNLWANRLNGPLPEYVHEFFDPTVPRKDRDRNHPAIGYLVGKDGVPGRREDAITKHVDAFKRDYPDRADLLLHEDMLRHARNGASKAVLLAKNYGEVTSGLRTRL